ncbi:glycosyltransferase [Wohlfahrtiimonas chitiniclastica]|nr:glycosyltransferase [Wohlfahrtiimonas chitiniclastica]
MPIPLKNPTVLECQNCHFTFKIIGDDLSFPHQCPKCGANDWQMKR